MNEDDAVSACPWLMPGSGPRPPKGRSGGDATAGAGPTVLLAHAALSDYDSRNVCVCGGVTVRKLEDVCTCNSFNLRTGPDFT